MGLKRQKKVSSALLSLSRSVQELTEENQSLKEDLDRVLSNSPTVSSVKGTVPGAARGGTLEERPRLAFFEGRCGGGCGSFLALPRVPRGPSSIATNAGVYCRATLRFIPKPNEHLLCAKHPSREWSRVGNESSHPSWGRRQTGGGRGANPSVTGQAVLSAGEQNTEGRPHVSGAVVWAYEWGLRGWRQVGDSQAQSQCAQHAVAVGGWWR